MAEVVVTFQDDAGSYVNLAEGNLTPEELQTEIEKFSTKHKDIVDLFDGNFFVKDEKFGDEKDGFDNSMWILFSPYEDLVISTRDTYLAPDDKPYRDKAILCFFENIKNETIGCGHKTSGPAPSTSYATGEKGFPDEFYQDLFKLTSKVFDDGELMWSVSNAVVVGYEGYYTGKITLTENGLIQITAYYDGEDAGDIW